MKAADLAARRPPRPPRPRFILALFRTIFTLAALAICQSTSPSSLSPSQTRTSACSHRINAFDYHVPFLNETALAATLSLYQSIDRPSTVMHQTQEAEICRIAVRNIVSAGRMLGARKRGLGGRGGRHQAVSAAFIAFSNRAPPKSAQRTVGRAHCPCWE